MLFRVAITHLSSFSRFGLKFNSEGWSKFGKATVFRACRGTPSEVRMVWTHSVPVLWSSSLLRLELYDDQKSLWVSQHFGFQDWAQRSHRRIRAKRGPN